MYANPRFVEAFAVRLITLQFEELLKSDEYKGIRTSSEIFKKGGSDSSFTQDVRTVDLHSDHNLFTYWLYRMEILMQGPQ